MSGRATDWALKVRGIRPSTRTILQILCAHHNHKTDQCNPSVSTLCEESELSRASVMAHLAKLETGGLIKRETRALGRGKGKSTDYTLNMSLDRAVKAPENDNLDVQEVRRPEIKTSRNSRLEVQKTGRSYKEEPEGTGKNMSQTVFDDIWAAWSRTGKKRSKSKAKCREALNRQIKKSDPDTLRRAALMFAKSTDGEWHPALERWLAGGQWENWIGDDRTPEQPSDLKLEDWQAAARDYCELEVWPHRYGPAPHEPGCLAPVGLLKSIANRMSAHNWHSSITENIRRAA